MYSKFLSLILSVFWILSFHAKQGWSVDNQDKYCLDVHHHYLKEAFYLTRNCVGFTPPVSGRAFAYFSLGMYESSVDFIPEMRSLSGQLNGYNRMVKLVDGVRYNRAMVSLACDHVLMNYLYRNMPPSNEKHLSGLTDSLRAVYMKGFSRKVNRLSEELGQKIAEEIIEWSKGDGADTGFEQNFPDTFNAPECLACWTKTTPGYLPSLLPYWGSNRWMIKDSEETMKGCEVLEFSTDTSSILYQDALSLLKNSMDKDPKYEIIAEYWDDSPGYSGTPSGHFYSIAYSLAIEKQLDLGKAIELYVKLGIAMNEAYIASWKLKYQFNFIRPITYIQRYINPQFNTRISTPPFPEFPSGHSYQSSAGGEILKAVFGDLTSFTDSTNMHRADFDGSPRSFASFSDMVREISVSRFYGGIHFMKTLEISMEYGGKLGRHVDEVLKCRK